MRVVLIFLLSLVVWSTASWACVLPREESRYQVEHEAFGSIGEEALTLHCVGDQLVVDRRIDVNVHILFMTAYHRNAHYTEVWQGDRLVRFESETNDNGQQSTLVVRAAASGTMIIDGPDGQSEVPETVIPTDPWNQRIVERGLQFDRTNGDLMEVSVVDAGDDVIEIQGRTIPARKFVLSGMRHQELWFDSAGTWIKSKIMHGTGTITITRTN